MPPLFSGAARRARWQTLKPYLKGSILDLGCGFTNFPDLLTDGQTYTGADAWSEAVSWSAERYPQFRFITCDLNHDSIQLPAASYDTVVMIAVLEHLHQPLHGLQEARRMLKSGRHLVLTTPSRLGDLAHRIGSRFYLFYSEEEVKHIEIFNRRKLFRIAEDAGLNVIHFKYFAFGLNQLLVCNIS